MNNVKGTRSHSVNNRIGFWIVLQLAFLANTAVAAELLRDLNPAALALGSGMQSPNDNARIGSVTLFAMNDGIHGKELWRSDGTANGTFLLKDIFPGSNESQVTGFTELGGRVVFWANDGVNGAELWTSDGTAIGTQIVANIDQGPYQSVLMVSSRPIPKLSDAVIFIAQDAATGSELWRSDGTRTGTWRIKDINPGSASSDPDHLTVLGGRIFFSAKSADSGRELWVTDGTTNGTQRVRDIAPGSAGSNPTWLTATDTALYFAADDGVHGSELWRADALGADATMVVDFVPGINGVAPHDIVSLGALVVFSGIDGTGWPNGTTLGAPSEPFRSDGTVGGTYLLRDIFPGTTGSNPELFMRVGNRVVFRTAQTVGAASSLWSTDGTSAGTQPLIAGDQFDFYNARQYLQFGSELLFYARLGAPGATGSEPNLWRTDGTPAGTRVFAQLPQPANPIMDIAVFGGRAYFPAGSCCTPEGTELWVSDGTPSGTHVVIDLNAGEGGSVPSTLFVANGLLYFFAYDGVHGREPWVTDGTAIGTRALGDFNPNVLGDSGGFDPVANLGSRVLFIMNDGIHGAELGVTDGTAAGTRLSRDINPGPSASSITNTVVMNGVAYFAANDGVTGNELWRSDGTTAGTYLVADIFPGNPTQTCQPRLYCPPPNPNPPPANSDPLWPSTVVFNNELYFAAADGTHGRELWRTDGTAGGTSLFFEFTPGVDPSWFNLLNVVGNRFFLCVQEGSVWRLWISDGTALGTSRVSNSVDCNPFGNVQSVAYQGVLYFAGNSNDQNTELWRSDGTSAGTYQVLEIAPGTESSNPSFLTVVGGQLVFGTNLYTQSDSGFYISNGLASGTVKVPGVPPPSGPPIMIGGRLYFSGSTGPTTSGLFVTDGTVAGTRPLFAPGAFTGIVYASTLTEYLGNAVFTVDDPVLGPAVWSSDGTISGTRLLADPNPGTENNLNPLGYSVIGNTLLFSAYDPTHGQELWAITNGAPSANDDLANAGYNSSTAIGILSNDGYVSSALNPSSVVIVSPPSHGSATIDMATGAVTYQSQTGFSGADTFTYRVRDIANRNSNIGQVRVLVAAPAGGAPGVAPIVTPPPPSPPPPTPTPTQTPTPTATPPATAESGGGGNTSFLLLWLLVSLLTVVRARERKFGEK